MREKSKLTILTMVLCVTMIVVVVVVQCSQDYSLSLVLASDCTIKSNK